jgi:hypothetical protein
MMSAAARFLKWSKAFPNARIAALGLMLILLVAGLLKSVEAFGWVFFKYLTVPVKMPNWESYWNGFLTSLWLLSIVLLPVMLAGMTMILFAAYRAVRDLLAKKLAL